MLQLLIYLPSVGSSAPSHRARRSGSELRRVFGPTSTCLLFYLLIYLSVLHSDVLLMDIYTVFYYLRVCQKCVLSRFRCAKRNFVPMMSYTNTRILMRACMFSHSSEAAIITAYFRLE